MWPSPKSPLKAHQSPRFSVWPVYLFRVVNRSLSTSLVTNCSDSYLTALVLCKELNYFFNLLFSAISSIQFE